MPLKTSKRKKLSKVDYAALDRQEIENLLDDLLLDIANRPRLYGRGKKDEDLPTDDVWEDWASELEMLAAKIDFKRKLLVGR